MRSSRGRISNSPPKPAKSSFTTRTSCSPTATAGRRRSPRRWPSRRPTDDQSGDRAGGSPHPDPPPLAGEGVYLGSGVENPPPQAGEESARSARVGARRARDRPMILQAVMFYLFAVVAVASGVMVVAARNPVHSVLFLILAFFNAAGLFVLMGAEFLAMILVIVYVGAVAVLFLFVVMMLDIDFAELRSGFQRYLPVGATVGAVLFIELALVLSGWKFAPDAATLRLSPAPTQVSNTAAL